MRVTSSVRSSNWAALATMLLWCHTAYANDNEKRKQLRERSVH